MSTPEQSIIELQTQLTEVLKSIYVLDEELKDRDDAAASLFEKENEQLEDRLKILLKCYSSLLYHESCPQTEKESEQSYEALRSCAVRYFEATKIDKALWSDVGS